MKNFIPYGRQFIDDVDIKAVKEILHLALITQGPRIDEFESRVADFCQVPYAVAFNSGTSALHGAMFAAGIGEGDEVITTPLTFVATANAALYVGAKPVFVDIDRENYCIDVEQIEAAITPRTKAIAPVDYAGYPVNISRIREIADKYNLVVIEDAAHALGSVRQGKMVGAEADMTMFSFHPVKHITTGEGGIIVCNNPDYYRRLKSFRSHGITKDTELLEGYPYPWYYEMQELGHNFRITDIQCALGISQMNKLEGFLSRRRLLAERYDQALGKLKWLRIPPIPSKDSLHAYHLYPLLLDANINRLDFYNYLKENNIGSQVHYFPVHLQPYYRKKFAYKAGDFPNAEDFYERQLSIPLFPGLTAEEQEWVIKVIEGYGR